MRKVIWSFVLSVFFLAACEYDVPLTTDHNIAVNAAILGTWEAASLDGGEDDILRIFRFSDTEYLVHDAEDDTYFRAYEIEIGGVKAVQMEFLGDDDKPVAPDGKNRYLVASYKFVNEYLEVRLLNSELVNDEITETEALRAAFIEHKENPGLWGDPGLFRRIKK